MHVARPCRDKDDVLQTQQPFTGTSNLTFARPTRKKTNRLFVRSRPPSPLSNVDPKLKYEKQVFRTCRSTLLNGEGGCQRKGDSISLHVDRYNVIIYICVCVCVCVEGGAREKWVRSLKGVMRLACR